MDPIATRIFCIIIYGIGAVFWVILWPAAGGFRGALKNRWYWLPALLPLVVFFFEIVFLSSGVVIENFEIEESLIAAIEHNTLQIVMGVFGTVILAAVLQSSGKKTALLSQNFVRFIGLSLIFIVPGVLIVWWVPPDRLSSWVLLRHAKTVPYTYAIAFFLAGLIDMMSHLGVEWDKES